MTEVHFWSPEYNYGTKGYMLSYETSSINPESKFLDLYINKMEHCNPSDSDILFPVSGSLKLPLKIIDENNQLIKILPLE